jgi:tetratricopeptide (TPR) repeat protein
MFTRLTGLLCISILFSCKQQPQQPIVEPAVIDSILLNYTLSPSLKANEGNLSFWKKRMDSLPDYFVNGPEYAAALISDFHVHGDLDNLFTADSLYQLINTANKGKEPAILRTMAGLAMLQHQFSKTDSILKKAIAIDGNSFPNTFLDFDVSFESGRYGEAKKLLAALQAGNEYGYLFRRAKFEHYHGSLDSAIACMERAADKAGNNIYLRQAALSNAADLYIHQGNLKRAYDLYRESLKEDPADLHSITGLGWIALQHDNNDSLAETIFTFVRGHTQSPDILLRLAQLEEARGNIDLQKEYATAFANKVSDLRFERMYSKYLVDLYTGTLHNPAKAVELSFHEINNRLTPQTSAWYAWSLFCNNEKEKAWQVYEGYVSGRPLEGLELYYMGKMMQGYGKHSLAKQFFKAAWKNRYDLSVARQKELEATL